jgi:dienelactone hydrolase
VEEEDFASAFELASEVEESLPDDPMLVRLWPDLSWTVQVTTVPEGANVIYRHYGEDGAEWRTLGRSPIPGARIPRGFFHWRFEKEGYQTVEMPGPRRRNDVTFHRVLDAVGSVPPEMVRVQVGNRYHVLVTGLEHLETPELEDYLIDRFEVTNRQFKEFVDSGGYQTPEYWKHGFVKDDRDLSWEAAMSELVDATGWPGPATWELGDYPDGQADYPVRGVSWYEAAAYAEFAGKRLPTVHHWALAAATHLSSWLVPQSNFGTRGPAPGGKHGGLGRFGTYDMAGNVKEWCWNASEGRRYILGGAWSEPTYMFNDPDAQSPFERQPTYGFRCMKSLSDEPLPPVTTDPIPFAHRDFAAIAPISDDLFEIYKRLFSYDKTRLNAEVERVDDSAEHWRMEKISFDAAYGTERLSAYLFIPKGVDPPFQTVVYFPGSGVIYQTSSERLNVTSASGVGSERGGIGGIDFLMKSGRAVVFPVFKGTYERGTELGSDCPQPTSLFRDHMIMWVKDLGRTLDYLERRGDFGDRFGLYGYSWGAAMGAILPALEDRLAVAVSVAGGYYLQETFPEVDQPTYAPRVTIPVLMLNGQFDFFYPVETSQKPMFDMLGTPPDEKRHIVYESGHSVPRTEGIKETLNWLDEHLGPVDRKRVATRP